MLGLFKGIQWTCCAFRVLPRKVLLLENATNLFKCVDTPCQDISLLRYQGRSFAKHLVRMASTDSHTMDVSASPQFQALLIPELCQLVSAFKKRGFEIRVVGGAVRDILIGGKSPKDIDLSTTASPDRMLQLFKEEGIHCIETGLQHGTLTAHMNGHDFEVTTLRIDVETYGRKAKVEFTSNWRLDAERRDLTINAMSVDIDGKLYDYFNGVDDLRKHNVRFVGDANKRIREDYLRILRYFRFYGRIALTDNQHDDDTLAVIKSTAVGLQDIAVERIWVEVRGILTSNHAPSLLRHIYDLGVAENIRLPEHSTSRLDHFAEVWHRVDLCKIQPVALLTTLVDDGDEAEELCRQWKLSNAERTLSRFIATHRNQHESHLKLCQELLARHGSRQTIDTLKLHCHQLLLYLGLVTDEAVLRTWVVPMFPVTGADLRRALDLKPGPILGRLLHMLKDAWVESYYSLTKEELLNKAKLYNTS